MKWKDVSQRLVKEGVRKLGYARVEQVRERRKGERGQSRMALS